MSTSGQCGCSSLASASAVARIAGDSFSGTVTLVVDKLKSDTGVPGACVLQRFRQSAIFTISMASAPSGQALTHAGIWPSASRPWHMSHLPTTPRASLNCGTP
jgi:hypothetical protein